MRFLSDRKRTNEQEPCELVDHIMVVPCYMSPGCLADLRIVVVEDHDDARRYLDLFLGQLGAKVIVARNAFEGLEAIKNTHPDLVLSDIKMPGMNGFELLDEIRALGSDAAGYSDERLFLGDRSKAHASRRFSGMPAEAIHSRQTSRNNLRYSLSRLHAEFPQQS
jgi:DNA-binding NarL/FixJ family response regulator